MGAYLMPHVFRRRREEFPTTTANRFVSYDAADVNSYPGTGSTVFSIGQTNSGTLRSGVTFDNDTSGSFVFNGASSNILLPLNVLPSYPTSGATSLTPSTISMWIKTTSSGVTRTFFGHQGSDNLNGPSGWVPVLILRGTNGRVRFEPYWTGSVSNAISSTTAINDGRWYNVTATSGGSTYHIYINGAQEASGSGVSQNGYSGTYYYYLGAGHVGSREEGTSSSYFSGKIAHFNYYSRVLSAAEVLENFNALKERFGR